MPKLIGSSQTVVNHEGMKIDEHAGNVATKDDSISIASVVVSQPTAEPWLTLEYDEWICVKKGLVELHFEDDDKQDAVLKLKEGDTAFIAKGERFRPIFPEENTEYIPVCLPAFRPDRCHREEDADTSAVTKKLRELHNNTETAPMCPVSTSATDYDADVLYHMCQKKLWDEAVESQQAYYPPTFVKDGQFTHATAVPQRLIETANHFYTETKGDWICLQLSRRALEKVGIITKDERSLPVGDKDVSNSWLENSWVCPHIYGGLPTIEALGVLTKIYPITRSENGTFLRIENLTH